MVPPFVGQVEGQGQPLDGGIEEDGVLLHRERFPDLELPISLQEPGVEARIKNLGGSADGSPVTLYRVEFNKGRSWE